MKIFELLAKKSISLHYKTKFRSGFTIFETKTAVMHKCISQSRTGRNDKNLKFNILHEHVGETRLHARFVRFLYAWCTLGVRRYTSL